MAIKLTIKDAAAIEEKKEAASKYNKYICLFVRLMCQLE